MRDKSYERIGEVLKLLSKREQKDADMAGKIEYDYEQKAVVIKDILINSNTLRNLCKKSFCYYADNALHVYKMAWVTDKEKMMAEQFTPFIRRKENE